MAKHDLRSLVDLAKFRAEYPELWAEFSRLNGLGMDEQHGLKSQGKLDDEKYKASDPWYAQARDVVQEDPCFTRNVRLFWDTADDEWSEASGIEVPE